MGRPMRCNSSKEFQVSSNMQVQRRGSSAVDEMEKAATARTEGFTAGFAAYHGMKDQASIVG